jgi:hypothetical protein
VLHHITFDYAAEGNKSEIVDFGGEKRNGGPSLLNVLNAEKRRPQVPLFGE